MDWLKVGLPISKVLFSITQNLMRLSGMLECWTSVTWHNRGIIKKVEESTAMTGQHGLLLGSLNCSSKMQVIGFLQLLAGLHVVSYRSTK